MNTFHNPLTTFFLLIFVAFILDLVIALRQFELPNPDDITKGILPSRSTVEPESTRSKYRGKSISGISGLLGGLSIPTSSIIDNQATPILTNSINTMPSTFTPTHIFSNEIPKKTQNPTPLQENSGIYNGGEIAYSWMVLSVVCAFLIGFVGFLSV